MRTEALRKVEEFNAKTRDVKADILHQPSSQIEEWIGGGSEFGANLFYLYVRYGIILFILLLVPALNLSLIHICFFYGVMLGIKWLRFWHVICLRRGTKSDDNKQSLF